MKEISGTMVAGNYTIGIVAGRFNEFITERLIAGARDALVRHGVKDEQIHCVWVPGAFEIPSAASAMLKTGKYQAVVALGAVIRGATPHFDVVVNQSASGVSRLSTEYDTPVIFGVLTVDSIEQAIERAGTKAGNKGAEAALAALEMIDVLKRIST